MQVRDSRIQAAMNNPNCKVRKFLRMRGRNRSTDALEWANFWSGLDTVTAEVFGASDGQVAEYVFTGSGSLISISEISYICEQTLTDRSITISCDMLNATLENAIRGYDLSNQPVEVYEGWFNLATNMLVAPAFPIFMGFVDTAPIKTPKAGDLGSIDITVRDHGSEMSRTNTLKRTHASEVLRNSNDTFYSDTGTVGNWKVYWGSEDPNS